MSFPIYLWFKIRPIRYTKKMCEAENILKLSLRDARAFVESLLNPPKPTPRMMEAAKRYMAAFQEQQSLGDQQREE
jgi:hypothetical protein